MLKNVLILLLICFPLYVLFSREPDFFDAGFSNAHIHKVVDSVSKQKMSKAFFTLPNQVIGVNADYLFTNYSEGQQVTVIYEEANPANASVYSIWGYWLRWKEIVSFIVLFVVLYQVAIAITGNPTPEALIEELEGRKPKPRRKRYDD